MDYSELKQYGRNRLKNNYWYCLLAALVLGFCTDGIRGGFKFSNNLFNQRIDLNDVGYDSFFSEQFSRPRIHNFLELIQYIRVHLFGRISYLVGEKWMLIGFIFVVIFVAFVITIRITVINPLSLGAYRFHVENHYQNVTYNKLGLGFEHYGNTVKTLFIRNLIISILYCVFVIPGVIFSYKYRLVPYLLAENPEADTSEILEKSDELMMGYKWEVFVFDLTFIGWKFLGALVPPVGWFYTLPYYYQSMAAVYIFLKNKKS